MPQTDTIPLVKNDWVLLTSNDVLSARLQPQGIEVVLFKATVGAVKPTSDAGAIGLVPYQLITDEMTFAQMFRGTVGANRIWAWTGIDGEKVSVSHG